MQNSDFENYYTLVAHRVLANGQSTPARLSLSLVQKVLFVLYWLCYFTTSARLTISDNRRDWHPKKEGILGEFFFLGSYVRKTGCVAPHM